MKERLTEQKLKIREVEKLKNNGIEDEEAQAQLEILEHGIAEGKIKLQEQTISDVMNDKAVEVIHEPSASVKAKRTTVKFEVTDIKELFKHHPNLVTLEPNDAAINEMGKNLKEAGAIDEEAGLKLKGLTFKILKVYA